MSRVDYRTCHTGDDAAAGYQRTYASGYYAAQWARLEQPLLTKLFSDAKARGGSRMLDIACGQGRIAMHGARYFDYVLGIDYSADMLAVAQHRRESDASLSDANLEFAVGDVSEFTASEPFDIVTAFRFFLNAQESLRVDALRCVRRNLAPGGTFITNVHVAGGSPLAWYWGLKNLSRRLSRQEADPVRNSISLGRFRRLLDQEGFRISSVYRYSLLPRIGNWTDSLAESHIEKFDRLAHAVPGLPLLCQSYLVCARSKTSADDSETGSGQRLPGTSAL